jgi:hypothetical protein
VTGVASAQVLARGALVAVTALVLAAMTVHLAPLARVVAAATAGLAIYAGIWARAGLLGTPEVVTGGDVG